MILVDTSVWIDHFKFSSEKLADLLNKKQVLIHPFIIGELSLGGMQQRATTLNLLRQLPRTNVANADEVLHFIEIHRLFGNGIGYVDVHLLAAAHLTPGTTLWTLDKRLQAAATELLVNAILLH